ncbi:hypothetical protein J4413_03060 [Candidatus Woesearchaeota archaeon]|nr:hypothetical protein [Candidatus Woesearchaeota archaeon]
MKLRIKDKEYEFYLLDNEISRFLPIKGKLIRWGDEIYILVDFDIDVRDDGKIFEVGDVIYWKSGKSGNKGIAVFFGNTPGSDKPKANDACTCKLIGKIKGDFNISDVERGDRMELLS